VSTEVFGLPIRVYYEDTDAGGVVYHSTYLNFMERCRTEWMRSMGYELDVMQQQHNLLFVVRRADVNYLRPALFNQQLSCTAAVTEMGASRLNLKQQIIRKSGPDDEVLVTAAVTLACLDANRFKPIRMPAELRESITMSRHCDRSN